MRNIVDIILSVGDYLEALVVGYGRCFYASLELGKGGS